MRKLVLFAFLLLTTGAQAAVGLRWSNVVEKCSDMGCLSKQEVPYPIWVHLDNTGHGYYSEWRELGGADCVSSVDVRWVNEEFEITLSSQWFRWGKMLGQAVSKTIKTKDLRAFDMVEVQGMAMPTETVRYIPHLKLYPR